MCCRTYLLKVFNGYIIDQNFQKGKCVRCMQINMCLVIDIADGME